MAVYGIQDNKCRAEVYSKDDVYSKDEVYSKGDFLIIEKSASCTANAKNVININAYTEYGILNLDNYILVSFDASFTGYTQFLPDNVEVNYSGNVIQTIFTPDSSNTYKLRFVFLKIK